MTCSVIQISVVVLTYFCFCHVGLSVILLFMCDALYVLELKDYSSLIYLQYMLREVKIFLGHEGLDIVGRRMRELVSIFV